MHYVTTTLLPVLPVVLLFALGFSLQKISFFSDKGVEAVRTLVSDIALPALLFTAFLSVDLNLTYLILVVGVFVSCFLMVLSGRFIGRLIGIRSPYFAFLMGGFEMGMLGYALFLSLYGQTHLGKFALVDLGQVTFVFFVLMAMLTKEQSGVQKFGDLMRRFITSPVIIAILSGIVLSFIAPHVEAGPFIRMLGSFIDTVASLTVPLIAIIIGYTMKVDRDNLSLALKTIAVRKVLSIIFFMILNVVLVRYLLDMDTAYSRALMVEFLLPAPFVIPIFMKQDDRENMDYVSATLSLDTLISIFLIIVASVFLS